MSSIIFVLAAICCCVGMLFVFKAFLKKKKVKKFFLTYYEVLSPNMLSLYGVLATVTGLVCLFEKHFCASLVFYGLASFLDGADGTTARALNRTSRMGKWLDPLCDKLRYFSFFLVFVFRSGVLAPVPVFAFFGVDLISQLSRIIIGKSKINHATTSANCFGKTKTVTADVLVGYCLLLNWEPWFPNFTSYLLYILAVLSACSTVFKIFSFGAVFGFLRSRIVRKTSVA